MGDRDLIQSGSRAPEIVGAGSRNKQRKSPHATPEQKRIYELEQELKQLKRGQGADTSDWMNMTGAQLNECKYRQFKANLVAHKKLVQMVAGVLGGAPENGLTYDQCRELAYRIDENYHLYIGGSAVAKLKKDINRLIGPKQNKNENDFENE